MQRKGVEEDSPAEALAGFGGADGESLEKGKRLQRRLWSWASPSLTQPLRLRQGSLHSCLWLRGPKHRPGGVRTSTVRPSSYLHPFWSEGLYSSPITAATNHHTLSGLRQHKFVLLRSGGRKCEMNLMGLNSRCWQGEFLLKILGENMFFAFSSF